MDIYTFFTETTHEGIVEHQIRAENCRKAYLMLNASGYDADEITIAGMSD